MMKKITLFLVMLFLSFTGYAQFPENFEGTTVPNATTGDWVLSGGTWKVFDNGIGLNQTWNVITGTNSCNGRAAYLNRENVTNGTFAEDWLVTPLTVPIIPNAQLRFITRQTLGIDYGSIYTIRVSTTSQTNAASFTTIRTWTETELNDNFNVCEEKAVSLAAYAGQQIYIAFVMTNDDGDRWIIDDINVVEQCLDPTNLTASNATLTSSTLGWTSPGSATNWEVEVVPSAATPTGTGTVVSTNSYDAIGLTQGTCYDFYVRSLCAFGTPSAANSEWIGPFNFCTVSLGETCAAPIPVSSFPYSTCDSTSNYGDDYSGSPGASGCGTTSTYLNGDDVFYSFTATTANSITISSLTNSNWSGLFVYSGCANVGLSCVAGTTGGNGTTVPDSVTFFPTVGQTYYVVISTFATNAATQSVNYCLDIIENSCTNMTSTFALVSNCGSITDPDTFYVTANVTNMGTATSITGTTTPASTTEVLTAPGMMQFGPFPNNTPVTINLQNDQDSNCFRNSTTLMQTFCPAPNNLCADAIPLTCNSTIIGTTQGSTSAGAFTAFCGTGSNTSAGVWYSFVGNGDVVTFSLCGSPFDTKIQVLTGTCGAFTCVAGNDNFCGTQSEVQITTTAGTNYYIYVFGATNTTQGGFNLNTSCVTPPPPPANDNCDTAINVPVNIDGSCSQTTAGTVAGATPSSQPNACVGSADDDVWFRFTATQAIHTITIQNVAGTSLDLNHVIYTSTNTTNPCGNLTQVFCSNPDFSYLTGLTAGQVYYVRVYTATAALLQNTTFDLCISVPPPPPSNDSCANPINVPVSPGSTCTNSVAGTVTSATASPEPNACGGTDDDDVWFNFTATNTTHIISLSNILGTVTDLNFVVYSGNSCGALTQILCSLPNSSSITNLTVGQTYTIRVYSATATPGQFASFDICVGSPSLSIDTASYTAEQLVKDVLISSQCALITNVTFQTGTSSINDANSGIAYFEENAPNTLPFPNGVILSTGYARNSTGVTTGTILSDTATGWGGDAQLLNYMQTQGVTGGSYNNASILEFDFMPLHNNFTFDFMFASDEYGTFQCTFSDAFAFFLTNTVTNQVTNLAVVPGTTTPVAVTTIRDDQYNAGCASVNPTLFDIYNGTPNSPDDPTNFNGQTVMLTAQANVTPNTMYHMKLVIADRNDTAYDSAVFLSANSFNVGDLDLGQDFLAADGNAICNGDTYLIDSGLNPANYSITWSNSAGVIPGETGPTLLIDDLDTYTISASVNGSTCAITDTITIEFYPEISVIDPDNLIACNNTGYGVFDLTQNETQMFNGINPTDYTISYHTSLIDAEAASNMIGNITSYTNAIQNLETIFVRFVNDVTGCVKIVSFDLIVQDLAPQFTLTNDFNICQNDTGTITVTPINFMDTDVTYTWTLDTNPLPDTTSTISINQAGVYTVVVDNNGCTASMSCTVTITPAPMLDPVVNVSACDSYTLPVLTVGSYFSQPGGVNPINVSNPITSTQTVYVYAESGTAPYICSSEASFVVTINTIQADSPADVSACNSYTLPSLSANNSYYTEPNGPLGTGTMLNVGDVISTTQVVYIYAQTNTTPNCVDQDSFNVTITTTPTADTIASSSVCSGSNYTFPALTSGSYFTGSNGSGTQYAPSDVVVINSTTTFYVYAESGTAPNTCSNETSFTVTAVDAPVVTLDGGCEGATYLIHATVVGGQAVSYQWYDSSNTLIANQTDSTLAVSQDGIYYCVVTLSSGSSCSSDPVGFTANGTLCTIQKGISPNGDGLNENFDLTGLNVNKLEIFNRYGKKVYSFSNYTDQWYGQSDNGNELPSGTYYYVIERDNAEAKSGWIYINR